MERVAGGGILQDAGIKKRNDASRRERGRRQMRKRSEGERDGKEKQRE